jgi:hypothetical protein
MNDRLPANSSEMFKLSELLKQKLKGPAEALHLLTRTLHGKFEFIFTALNDLQRSLMTVANEIHR